MAATASHCPHLARVTLHPEVVSLAQLHWPTVSQLEQHPTAVMYRVIEGFTTIQLEHLQKRGFEIAEIKRVPSLATTITAIKQVSQARAPTCHFPNLLVLLPNPRLRNRAGSAPVQRCVSVMRLRKSHKTVMEEGF